MRFLNTAMLPAQDAEMRPRSLEQLLRAMETCRQLMPTTPEPVLFLAHSANT